MSQEHNQKRPCHADDRIMDVWDNGLTTRQIAAHLQLSEHRIRSVISAMSVGPADRWQTSAAAASAALATRILEIHGVMA